MADVTIDGRGFHGYAEFIDSYGGRVRVKESSAAMGPHVWVFVEGGGLEGNNGTMHLNLDQATRLRDALTKFIDEVPERWDLEEEEEEEEEGIEIDFGW